MANPVIVIGAGPAGLAIGACMRARGVEFAILDRSGEVGGAYREIHDGMTLASPTVFNLLPGLDFKTASGYTKVPEYRDYLQRYAAHHQLTVERGTVESVAREQSGFRLTVDGKERRARFVVIATGMWDFPVMAEIAGDPSLRIIHARAWRGAAAHPEKKILIIGGATAAIEIAEELARANRHVTVSARSGVKIAKQRLIGIDLHHWIGPLDLIPTSLAKKYCGNRPTLPGTDLGFGALRTAGLIEVRPKLSRIERAEATFSDGTSARFDLVVLATGFRFDTPFLPPEVARAPAGHVLAKKGESSSWPGLFLVGAPCAAHISSEFLRGVNKDAPLVAERIASRR